jgi:arylsulfatase A-like enzyme
MKNTKRIVLYLMALVFLPASIIAQEVLPFKKQKSGTKAGVTMEQSIYAPTLQKSHLPDDAPNIVIILIDDAGPASPSAYGGEINTPNLAKVANEGISYGAFHSTAMCSPTRSSLMTGRNHTRVGNGQISEISNDFDGFTGMIPKTSATTAEVLQNYGYSTAAFGKWHMTPVTETSAAGPFDNWPTGYGFDYFYGFLGGESSQYEPYLVKNTTYVDAPKTPEEGYHLTEDLADNAIEWMKNHQALAPDKPFYIYWATGAVHGPHHITKEWADKYKGKFDDGWEAYRERTYKTMMEQGLLPANTKLTAIPDGMQKWADIPESQRPFQSRLMEIWAGFAEHTDHHAGRVINELEELGIKDNTLVFYIWGDNGSSSEGIHGTVSELLTQNQIPVTLDDQLKVLEEMGGLDVLGTPATDNHYNAGWAWAASTPYKGTKLTAAYFGGTRQPLAVSWPAKIKHDTKLRTQFHHVSDVGPTIFEILDITPPKVVNGYNQDPIDGISMLYTFNDAEAPEHKKTQFFDIMGSRGIYNDGWYACTFGPRVPWMTVTPGMGTWTPDKDVWELYNLKEDWSQANDLAKINPKKLQELKDLFLVESARNYNMPIGGGLWALLHPEFTMSNPATEYNYTPGLITIPEFFAAKIARRHSLTTLTVDMPEKANGVLFALGGSGAGITCFMEDGYLNYEYNCFIVQRTKLKSKSTIPAGKTKIEILLEPTEGTIVVPGELSIKVNGESIGKVTVPNLANLTLSTEGLEVGRDEHSPVSPDYAGKGEFEFTGTIHNMNVKYLSKK